MPQRGGEILTGGIAPYQTYRTKDGEFMALGALEPKFFMAFCRAVGIDADSSLVVPGTAPNRAQAALRRGVRLEDTRGMGGVLQGFTTFASSRCCAPTSSTPIRNLPRAASSSSTKPAKAQSASTGRQSRRASSSRARRRGRVSTPTPCCATQVSAIKRSPSFARAARSAEVSEQLPCEIPNYRRRSGCDHRDEAAPEHARGKPVGQKRAELCADAGADEQHHRHSEMHVTL